MEVLRFLEGIRTPALDGFFAAVTHLGEETLFILAGLLFFWCIDKKKGYYLLSVGFVGTLLNQFLKLLCQVPRPWVQDPEFTIVESARAEATGYSFPSGHSQTAVGIFGGIARFCKYNWLRVVCIVICVLVPVSRMYLGVHTPLDVGVGALMAVVLIFVTYPIVQWATSGKRNMRIFFSGMVLISGLYLVFVLCYPFPADIDGENLAHGIENAFKIAGCVLGLWLAFEIDEKYLHFETKGVWWVQILKLVIGLIPLLAIKSGLKAPLLALLDGSEIAGAVRYFLMTAFAGCVWPWTFQWFRKLDKKNR